MTVKLMDDLEYAALVEYGYITKWFDKRPGFLRLWRLMFWFSRKPVNPYVLASYRKKIAI